MLFAQQDWVRPLLSSVGLQSASVHALCQNLLTKLFASTEAVCHTLGRVALQSK